MKSTANLVTLSQPKEKAEENCVSESPSVNPKRNLWTIFSSTFLTIFFAEMGDKTQLATLLMSAESQSPWIVFAGASLALILTSLLGVLLGRWLGKRVAPETSETAAAVLLLFITVMLLWDIAQS